MPEPATLATIRLTSAASPITKPILAWWVKTGCDRARQRANRDAVHQADHQRSRNHPTGQLGRDAVECHPADDDCLTLGATVAADRCNDRHVGGQNGNPVDHRFEAADHEGHEEGRGQVHGSPWQPCAHRTLPGRVQRLFDASSHHHGDVLCRLALYGLDHILDGHQAHQDPAVVYDGDGQQPVPLRDVGHPFTVGFRPDGYGVGAS